MLRFASLAFLLAAAPLAAQTTKTTKTQPATPKAVSKGASTKAQPPRVAKTTLSGVYTLDEAAAGKELYLGLCASCHQAVTHTGPAFRKKWTGKPLSQLYTFMRTMMPKNEPGSLADEDYGVLLAYMLQMNQMPAGKTYLSTDTLELRKIRIDTVRTSRK
jgi:S-disulfanyl-L-cysteine oxidoreductase SoxD